jgi:two-component system, OmpR family, sensor histidine kinase CiaH
LRLTVLFGAVMLALVAGFGLVLYFTLSSDLHDVVEQRTVNEAVERVAVHRALSDARLQILLVNGVVIVVVGAFGAWLARRTLSQLRLNFAAQKRFVANASHELRTPLAIMKAEFEVGAREADCDCCTETLASGLEEIERMSRLVDDLLTLSRIDADQENLVWTAVGVDEMINGVAADLATLARARGVELRVTGSCETVVEGDRDHLERALRNVVKNAIDHSPSGTEVLVRAEAGSDSAGGPRGNGVRIVVADRGAGIPAADLPHIFERFYRAERARERASGGSGLGLAIAQWVVRAHGGSISVRSEVGAGTTVTLVIPARSRHT